MSTIPRLPTRVPVAGDLIPFFSSSNGDDSKCSFSALATLISSILGLSGASTAVTKYLTSVDGTGAFTKSNASNSGNVWWIINLTGAEASYTLTLTLPDESYVTDMQEFVFSFNGDQNLEITFDGNGATVIASPVTITDGGSYRIRYDQINNTWYKV